MNIDKNTTSLPGQLPGAKTITAVPENEVVFPSTPEKAWRNFFRAGN